MKDTMPFAIELEVRDYELDIQGIVNNAVYFHYLEYARQRFLQSLGFKFTRLHQEGIDPVVVRVELDYLSPLQSGDRFQITVRPDVKGRLRLLFYQEIFKIPCQTPVLRGLITATCLVQGRPHIPPLIYEAFREASKKYD